MFGRIIAGVAVALGWVLVVEAQSPAHEDLQTINAIIEEHGKAPFIQMILDERSGRITIDVGGKLKTGYGPPNQRFITPTTIARDLSALDAAVNDLPELLAPYLDTNGAFSPDKGFRVSDANLAEVAGRGRISDSGDAPPLAAGIESDPDVTSPEATVGQSDATTTDLNVPGREQRTTPTDEEAKKAYWIGKIRKVANEVTRLEAEVEALEKSVAEIEKGLRHLGGEVWHTDQWGVQRRAPQDAENAIMSNFVKKKERLGNARIELSSARTKLNKLKAEARRDGAKPGWFRGLG